MKKKRNHEFCDLADIWGVTIVPRFQCRWIKTRKKQLVSTTANSNLTRSEVERNWKEYPFIFLSKRRRKIILRSLKHNLGQRISFSWCLDVKEYFFFIFLSKRRRKIILRSLKHNWCQSWKHQQKVVLLFKMSHINQNFFNLRFL